MCVAPLLGYFTLVYPALTSVSSSLQSRNLNLFSVPSAPYLRPSHLRLQAAEFRYQDARRDPRVEVSLKLQKLAHEVEIGRHHGTAAPHVFVDICHSHEGVLHKVGNYNGCRTGHACLAVYQHALSTLMCLFCGRDGEKKNIKESITGNGCTVSCLSSKLSLEQVSHWVL